MPDSCAPDYGDSNPCRGTDPALIREMGKPGSPGVPGGTPAFVVGTVITGAAPSVTYTMVNPLLYRVDYIIPGAGVATENTWALLQTFDGGILTTTIIATGLSTLTDLLVTGGFTVDGAAVFNGSTTFNSSASFLTGVTALGDSTMLNLDVQGDFLASGAIALPANVVVKGRAVLDSCGKLYYIDGLGPNSVSGSSGLAQVVTFNNAEATIAFNLPFSVPAVADCGVALNSVITITGDIVTNAGGALPTDVSRYQLLIRLDSAAVGTIVGQRIFTNFEAGGTWYFSVEGITPGAHTLFFTIQGQGVGTSSTTLIAIDCSVLF